MIFFLLLHGLPRVQGGKLTADRQVKCRYLLPEFSVNHAPVPAKLTGCIHSRLHYARKAVVNFLTVFSKNYRIVVQNFFKNGTAFVIQLMSIIMYRQIFIMKNFYRNFLLTVVMVVATFVGWVKGQDAKQKLVYKWKTGYNEKRQLARKRIAIRKGQVILDEVEWASFHTN
jgi:hypothetical protein